MCLSIRGFWGILVSINENQTQPESSVLSLLNIQKKKWLRMRMGSGGGRAMFLGKEENKAAMAFLPSSLLLQAE